ncbi:hypothetical protein CK203_104887 [Vitis vinifera]|uniref:Uncharacterized protein n=1 Tax=Vitis vinifera TaxID=29760 RepID=A0A438DHK2_VITVI|nr:hypothetical protein CK203_104887 [Vitis vinifera]
MGQQPLSPHLVIGYTRRSPTAFKLAEEWHEQANIAHSYLDKATKKMKKWADMKRCHTKYKIRDTVFVKLFPQQFKLIGLKIHHVFHLSYLKPYHENKDNPSRGMFKRAPIVVVTFYDKEVEYTTTD